MTKRILALLLCLVLCVSLIPAAYAGDIEIVETEPAPAERIITADGAEVFVNPLYRGVLSAEDLAEDLAAAEPASYSADCATLEEAAAALRAGMKARESSVSIRYTGSQSFDSSDIFEMALAHTGDPKEGDYLAFQYGGMRMSGFGGTYDYTISYYTDGAQEAEMDTAVSSLMKNLQLNGKTEYEKVRAIYDYVCAHTVYDYDNLYDSSYKLKYTAYAALINGTSVCQGYAVLIYRLMLTAGVDCRVVTSEDHAWNIVRLGEWYYNIDATWDAGNTGFYYWFLKCMAHFPDHEREAPYNDEPFLSDYPMSPSDYEIGGSPITLESSELTLWIGGPSATVRFTVDSSFSYSSLGFTYPGNGIVSISGTFSSVTVTPKAVGAGVVSVVLRDGNGTVIAKADIYVTVLAEEPQPTTPSFVTDYTKGAAVTSLDPGTSYSGTVSFTISSPGDKPVLAAVKNGDVITVLKCTTTNGVHSYTASIGANTELILVFKGDVNLDGDLKASDGTMLKRAVLETYTYKNPSLSSLVADVNGDGTVKASEGTMVSRAVLGTYTIAW